MDSCCDTKGPELAKLATRQGSVLRAALVINLAMFGIEAAYGWLAHSTALLADSLDMLGDAFVYGVSLYAIGRSPGWISGVSALKGFVMIAFGAGVLGHAAFRYLEPSLPEAATMGWVGGLALFANAACALLLFRHRGDDLNMKSTWLCSRNDVIANAGVLVAAALVAITRSTLPDLLVGIAIAALVLRSGIWVLRSALARLRAGSVG
jgi:Co/Zn/Cd efflux system component